MKKHWTKFFIVIMVCAGLLLGAWQTLPPDAPKGLDETPITLSEASPAPDLRMMLSHLRAMTGAPRPLGSEALADAQQYITDQLTQMGAEYEVHRYELGIKPGNALSLNNIIVTVKGKNPDEAVLFVAHTDSVSTGPGAFDDMVSVTALLEAIRALAGQTPARDIVFVLTDGEELGMWGAMRYVKDHPEMKEKTRLVVNLDARGNAGSMMLFETSGNNLGLLRAYQRAARHPYGLSLAQSVFRMMQNGTDLTSFLNAGYPGINLAVLNNALVYHTLQDNYETFSRASAQQFLHTAWDLVRHLGFAEELALDASKDAVFFPLLPGKLLVMPQGLANILAYLAAALLLLALALMLKRGAAQARDVLRAMRLQVIALLGAGAGAFVLMKTVMLILGIQTKGRFFIVFKGDGLLFILILVILTALCGWRYLRAFKNTYSPPSFALGSLVLPGLLVFAAVFYVPEGSYLLAIPVLFGLAALGVYQMNQKTAAALVLGLGCLIVMMLYVPAVALVYVALGANYAPASAVMAMLAVTLLMGLSFLLMDMPGLGLKKVQQHQPAQKDI